MTLHGFPNRHLSPESRGNSHLALAIAAGVMRRRGVAGLIAAGAWLLDLLHHARTQRPHHHLHATAVACLPHNTQAPYFAASSTAPRTSLKKQTNTQKSSLYVTLLQQKNKNEHRKDATMLLSR